jgi:hypothetical protein
MLDPEFGFSSDRNLEIIHLEKPKKAPRMLTTPTKTAEIVSGFKVNIHQVYNRSRLTFGGINGDP